MIGALPPLQGCLYSRDSKPPTPTASRGSWAILRLDASAPCGGAASLRIVLTRMIQNGRPSGARHRHARYGSLSGGLASLAGVLTAPNGRRRMPFWDLPAPTLADRGNSRSGCFGDYPTECGAQQDFGEGPLRRRSRACRRACRVGAFCVLSERHVIDGRNQQGDTNYRPIRQPR
jgi:hypothetical protein